MKKAIKIIVPVTLVLIAAVGLVAGFTHGKNWSRGTLLKTERGVVFWIDENGSPIELSFMNDLALKAADKYATGDGIVLLHDMILESYPARTGCYYLIKTGGKNEIPADTIASLTDMGWLSAGEGTEAVSAPAVIETVSPIEYATGENTVRDPVYATCGNTLTVLKKDGKEYRFMFEDSCALFNLLGNLRYGGKPYAVGLYPDDITVLLEDGCEYRVSLNNAKACALSGSELFGRKNGGSCILSKAQCEEIAEIVERVEKADPAEPAGAPADFTFSLTWNTYGISSYNSETGELIKTTDATRPEDYVTRHTLTEDEKARVYGLIRTLDVTSYPDIYNPNEGVYSEPSVTLILSVRYGGVNKTITAKNVAITESKNKKGQAFLTVCEEIAEILTSTPEWEALPDYEFYYD